VNTQPAVQKETPAWRLVMTLAGAGTFAGLLLVFVFQATAPAIAAHKAEMLRLAVQEVLADPERYDTLYLYQDRLTPELPEGVRAQGLERVYLGYGADGEAIGFAIAAGEPGFQDTVRLIFGYDPRTKQLLGMKVLESKETPGLGDKIEKDMEFVHQFRGVTAPLVGYKRKKGDDPSGIDMITGATISSRAVIRIINHALERYGRHLDAYMEEDAKR